MIVRTVLLIIFVLVQCARAEPARVADDEGSAEGQTDRVEVQGAPGGGEMIILGPASRYVTRWSRADRGKVTVGCERHGAAGNGAREE